MQIQTTHSSLKNVLTTLIQTLRIHGAQFHKDLVLRVKGNQFSVHMDSDVIDGEVILKIPFRLMLPSDDLNFSYRNQQFHIDPDHTVLSQAQMECAYLMCEAYNLTNKAEMHIQANPWITYKDHKHLLELLFHKRHSSGLFKTQMDFFYDRSKALPFSAFVCWSFLKSRVLNQKTKRYPNGADFLMVFTDFFNHHPHGAMYNVDKTQESLCVRKHHPLMRSNECFARYGRYDGLDIFLNYGYIDTHTPFVHPICSGDDDFRKTYEFYENARTQIKQAEAPKHLKKPLKKLLKGEIEKLKAHMA